MRLRSAGVVLRKARARDRLPPLRQGNKRTAVVLLYGFLRANDHDLTLSGDELFELAGKVADQQLSVADVEAVVRPALASRRA